MRALVKWHCGEFVTGCQQWRHLDHAEPSSPTSASRCRRAFDSNCGMCHRSGALGSSEASHQLGLPLHLQTNNINLMRHKTHERGFNNKKSWVLLQWRGRAQEMTTQKEEKLFVHRKVPHVLSGCCTGAFLWIKRLHLKLSCKSELMTE